MKPQTSSAQTIHLLYEAAQYLGETLDPEKVYDRLHELLSAVVPHDGLVVSSYDPEKTLISCEYVWVDGAKLDPATLPPLPLNAQGEGMQSRVIHSGQSLLLNDVVERVQNRQGTFYSVDSEGNLRQVPESGPPATRAAIMTPVKLQGQVLGVVQVMSDRQSYTQDQLELVEGMVAQMSAAARNAKLYQAAQREITERKKIEESLRQAEQNMRFLADLSEQMRRIEEPQELLWLVVQVVGDYLQVSRCLFSEVDVMRGQEVIHRDYYQGLPSVAGTYAHSSFSPATVAELQAGHTVVNVDVRHDPRTAAYFEQSYRPYGIGAYVAVPLLRNNQWTSMLWVSAEQPRKWSEQEVSLLQTAAERAWLALERARLDNALRRERAQLKQLNETLEQQVRAQTEQVRQLAAALTLTEQQERRQLARDLHDSAGQSLTALQIYLNLVEREIPEEFSALRQKMAEARAVAQEAHDEVRAISHAMRPPVLDQWGLQVALEELCHDFARRTNLSVKYQGDELPSLDDQVSINFYRFLQEALTNTAKHAQANAVQVVLSYQGGQLLLSVEDDGVGFDARQELSLVHSPTGIGLQGLQERFHLLGGQVEIDSQPGRGTRLAAQCHVVNK